MTIESKREQKKILAKLIGERLRSVIKQRGLILKYICKKVGITEQTMQNYLNGETYPDLIVLLNLSKACGEDIGFLVMGENRIGLNDLRIENERLHSENDQLRGQVALLREMLNEKKQSKV